MEKKDNISLTWAGKTKETRPSVNIEITKKQIVYPYTSQDNSVSLNERLNNVDHDFKGRLINGNNLEVMYALLEGGYKQKFDLIYLDPPYFSQSNYSSKVKIASQAGEKLISRNVFTDSWSNLDDYLNYIWPILIVSRQLLSDKGSLFVHADWHASHYIRILLDEIFSRENLVNEIIWCYGGGSNAKRHLHKKHDTILWYGKTKDYIFNPIYRPYTEKTKARGLTKVKGSKYKLNDKGALMHDWWTDINKILSPTAYENLKFPTQKPIKLLNRIIKAASNEGSLIGDFFAGSGTTAAAAENLQRRWLTCDNSNIAIQTTHGRLLNIKARPYKIETTSSEKPEKLNIDTHKSSGHDLMVKLAMPDNNLIYFWEMGVKNQGVFNSLIQFIRPKFNANEIKTEIILKNINHIKAQELIIKGYDYEGNTYQKTININ